MTVKRSEVFMDSIALERLQALSIGDLCRAFEATNDIPGLEVVSVRGWLMDRLEKLDPGAFERWIDTPEPADMDFPSRFFL